jgi:hypothetical protein
MAARQRQGSVAEQRVGAAGIVYFQNWRDSLGNWHEKPPAGGRRHPPQDLFRPNDNAVAIYQVKSDTPSLVGGSGTNGNIYFNNGESRHLGRDEGQQLDRLEGREN